MSVISYKCPCCSSPLAFSGESGKLSCASCGNAYEADTIEVIVGTGDELESGNDIRFEAQGGRFSSSDAAEMRAYTCSQCGAELLCEDSTSATQCAYCGSPAIMAHVLERGTRPAKVIPFRIDKRRAEELFNGYFKGKRLIPNVFLNTRNRISEMRKLYVPYWLFDCEARASITFDAERTKVTHEGDCEVRRTSHYWVKRSGSILFEGIPVDGSAKLDDKITESLEPYDLSEAIPFSPAVLSGAMADIADVAEEECRSRAVQRLERSTQQAFCDTVTNYDRVTVKNSSIISRQGVATAVLFPVWLITTEKTENGEKAVYTFAINGQTGALTCDVPHAKGKSRAWFCGLAGGFFAVGYALLVALRMIGVIG